MFDGGLKSQSGRYEVDHSKARYPDVLLQCRTVVEKQHYVATGLLTFAEGDVVEVELDEHGKFRLGEAVKITIYSPVGILVFQSTVIAKGTESIMILNSREISNKFGEARQFPRVMVNASATISGVLDEGDVAIPLLMSDPNCKVDNISMGGIGLLFPRNDELKPKIKLQMSIQLQFEFSCTVEIVRVEDADQFQYFGTKFVEFPNQIVNPLRSFILKQQLDSYYQNKNKNKYK
ncbi:MAG: PilZ domain-containing protein [Paenibacillaceae bacterium]